MTIGSVLIIIESHYHSSPKCYIIDSNIVTDNFWSTKLANISFREEICTGMGKEA
jgi:hypothetical protein